MASAYGSFPISLLNKGITMKKTTALITILLASTLLSACSVKHKEGGTTAGKVTSGLWGMNTASDIAVEGAEAFKGKNQVVIGSFKVGFLEEKKASAKAGMGGFGGKSTAHMKMTGIDQATMQAITEAAYADFVAKLQAAGYSVADRSALLASEDFKGVSSDVAPLREEKSFFGSSNTVTYLSPKALGDKIYWAGGEAGRTGGFGFANSGMAAANYAGKSGTPVLFVSYLVDFANSEDQGGFTTSAVSVGQGISVAPGSGINYYGAPMGGTFSATTIGSVKLGQPVSSGEAFGQIQNTSSDTAVVAETALNVVGAVLGAGTNQSRDFEIAADAAKYKTVSTKVLGEANSALTHKMGALK